MVTFGGWRDAKTTFAQLAAKATPWDEPVAVAPEALSQRMHKRAPAFLQEMLQRALATTHALAPVGCAAAFGAPLTQGYRADSTGWALPDSLPEPCPGSGGRAAKAEATMQAVWDYKSSRLEPCALTPWHMPEQK